MIKNILNEWQKKHASDIIISAWGFPSIKVNWKIIFLDDFWVLNNTEIEKDLFDLMWEKNKIRFLKDLELDFWFVSWELRYRWNIYYNRNWISAVFRVIQINIPDFKELGLPYNVLNFTKKRNWLILVTWSVASGKSTTLASLINYINQTQSKHIITIEDPIEFVYKNELSLIDQREIWKSTHSFNNALQYSLRQSPDIIMIGEIRDIKSIRLALRAAETGNLVLWTLHTSWATKTISRIIDMFPWEEKDFIRSQLSENLIWILWQELIERKNWWRVAISELLLNNNSVSNAIREKNIHQINNIIETGLKEWMVPMSKSLDFYLKKWVITEENYNIYRKLFEKDL